MGWAVRDVVGFRAVKLDQPHVRTFPVNAVFRLKNAYARIRAVVVHPKRLIDFIVHDAALDGVALPRLVRGDYAQRFVDGQLFRRVKHAMRADHRFDEEIIDKGLFSGMHFFIRDFYHPPLFSGSFSKYLMSIKAY